MATGFRWITPPSALSQAIGQYNKRVLAAVHAVAAYVGEQMQASGRLKAPWQDRTGNARSGLFYAVDGFGLKPMVGVVLAGAQAKKTDVAVVSGDRDTLVLAFGHTVYYGKYLELCNAGRYAIVMSTIESHLPILERMLRNLLA